MALVGEAFLTATVQVLCDKIASQEFRRFLKQFKLNVQLLDKLKMTLLTLEAVLNVAEEKQITSPVVEKWLTELQDAVFDAEELLDQISYEDLKSKVEQDQSQITSTTSLSDQVRGYFGSTFGSYHNRGLNSKIEEIYQRMEHFASQIDKLGLTGGLTSFGTPTSHHRRDTSSLVNEPALYGRDHDKEKLVKVLLSEEEEIGVVTIVGMGGIGKTTLARHLYNDDSVKKHFKVRAWAFVSEYFDPVKVTKTLLDKVNPQNTAKDDLDSLQLELKNSIKGDKFLFVLDDAWHINYKGWDDLLTPLHTDNKGSKVIVTSRSAQNVPKLLCSCSLEPLPLEDCWSLLAKHALIGGKKCNNYTELERIGRKIAEKCDGLPLAALTLGGILGSNLDTKEWNKILRSNIWELNDDNIIPALRLSYHYLPASLKQCFAYCSTFSKGYSFEKRKIVLIWMAAGLIQPSQNEKPPEEIGEEYFDELLSRSLIQKSRINDEEKFNMHDHLNDLAFLMS